MKAKYLLRGLGLGMIITAVVMGAYTRSAVADARVAVLKEYGIGEEAVLAETLVDIEDNEAQEEESAVKSSESARGAVTESVSQESTIPVTVPYDEELEAEIQSVLEAAEQSEGNSISDIDLESDSLSQQEQDAGEQNGTVTIEILRGDDSGTVARKLYNAGLVENAAEYDAFLMQHGYDKKLNTGTKIINVTDSWQEIAEKLAKR